MKFVRCSSAKLTNVFFKSKIFVNIYPQWCYFVGVFNFNVINMDIERSFVFISKNWNLPGLAFNELILNHSITPTRSVFRSEIKFSMFFPTLYSVLSSAKLQTPDFLINKNKSFINKTISLQIFLRTGVIPVRTWEISSLQMSLWTGVSHERDMKTSSLQMFLWNGASPVQASKVMSLQTPLWTGEALSKLRA